MKSRRDSWFSQRITGNQTRIISAFFVIKSDEPVVKDRDKVEKRCSLVLVPKSGNVRREIKESRNRNE
jgi:hypothetical protein